MNKISYIIACIITGAFITFLVASAWSVFNAVNNNAHYYGTVILKSQIEVDNYTKTIANNLNSGLFNIWSPGYSIEKIDNTSDYILRYRFYSENKDLELTKIK